MTLSTFHFEIRSYKDTNRKIRTSFFNFGFKFLARHVERLLCTTHIASDFTCVFGAAAGTIDVCKVLCKKSVKIQTVTESLFIDKNRRVISFFKAKNMGFKMKNKKTH